MDIGAGEYLAMRMSLPFRKVAVVQSVTQMGTLTDEFAPFLRPTRYVDYTAVSVTVDTIL